VPCLTQAGRIESSWGKETDPLIPVCAVDDEGNEQRQLCYADVKASTLLVDENNSHYANCCITCRKTQLVKTACDAR